MPLGEPGASTPAACGLLDAAVAPASDTPACSATSRRLAKAAKPAGKPAAASAAAAAAVAGGCGGGRCPVAAGAVPPAASVPLGVTVMRSP